LKINRIEKNIEELQKKYTTKGSDIKRIERKVEMIKKNKMMLDDAFYQLKMEISRLGK
jgi:predicted nuclease with TOPRIM domain